MLDDAFSSWPFEDQGTITSAWIPPCDIMEDATGVRILMEIFRYERSYGVFERTFALPNTVDPDQVEAGFEGGVLTVTLPKAERMRPREIKVKTSA